MNISSHYLFIVNYLDTGGKIINPYNKDVNKSLQIWFIGKACHMNEVIFLSVRTEFPLS